LIIGIVEAVSATWLSADWKDVVVFTLFLAVLLFRPQGLFGKRGGE
jgi:branched-chain amino acid transport system permease protein